MSLFYGYSKPEKGAPSQITKQLSSDLKQLNNKLKAYTETHNHRVIFNLNVTRASKNAISKLPPFIEYIEDKNGGVYSAMFWRPPSINPQLNTAGDHHFIHPEMTIRTVFHVSIPRLMFVDVSVFAVVKRNSVRPKDKLNEWEMIVTNNGKSGPGKSFGFKAGVSDKLLVEGSSPAKFYECTIPAKFIGKKVLISAHWLSGVRVSHVRINGEMLRDSFFMSNIGQIGTPYLNVFGLNRLRKYYSDINFYGMRIVEGRLGGPDIEKICKEVMVEYDL